MNTPNGPYGHYGAWQQQPRIIADDEPDVPGPPGGDHEPNAPVPPQDLLQDLHLLWNLAWDIWCGASLVHLLHLDKWFLGLEDMRRLHTCHLERN